MSSIRLNDKAEKARYLLVGAVATAIDYGVLFALRYLLNIPTIPANIGSTGLAFCFSFFGNKRYTFKSSGESLIKQMALFTALTLFGLWFIQNLIIHLIEPMLYEILSSSFFALLAAKLIATGATLLWNYFTYSRVVFKK